MVKAIKDYTVEYNYVSAVNNRILACMAKNEKGVVTRGAARCGYKGRTRVEVDTFAREVSWDSGVARIY